jgi:transposase
MEEVQRKFQLDSWTVGALPIVNRFLERLRVPRMLEAYLEEPDPRCAVAPGKVLLLLLRNLIMDRHPLYRLSEWARAMLPDLIDFDEAELGQLNDDRIGRALDRLFDADRSAMMTELVLQMLQSFEVDVAELHNDSTTLTLHGSYPEANGEPMRGKPTVAASRGHSKDHRPDLKQLLWILTVSSDGGVPIHFKVSAGNIEDSSTHIHTWNQLRELVGRPEFLYVADSKLCTQTNMRHIDERGGSFITVMPRSRKEDGLFRQWLLMATPHWEPIAQRPHPRWRDGPPDLILAMESPIPDPQGFRILWFFSSHKMQREIDWRQDSLRKAREQLDAFEAKLQGPKCRYHTRKGVTDQIDEILAQTQTAAFIAYRVTSEQQIQYRNVERGEVTRKYRRRSKLRFLIHWETDPQALRAAAKTDGVFPLITNRRDLSALEVFNAYKCKQPLVEQRHDLFKNILMATPLYLQNIGRIEALLFLEFIALMVHALIERQLRRAMNSAGQTSIPLYPEERPCKAPTTTRLIELFQLVQFHRLRDRTTVIQEFGPELSDIQRAMIQLAGMDPDAYSTIGIQRQMSAAP